MATHLTIYNKKDRWCILLIMFTIDTYRATLSKIIEFIKKPTQTKVGGLTIGQTPDGLTVSPHTEIIEGTPTIIFTEEEMRVANVLAEEGEMNILSIQNSPTSNQFSGSGRLIPNGDLILEIDLSDENLLSRMEARLTDLNSWLVEHSSVFGDVSDGRTIETGRHQGFVSYGSGLITFNGKPIILPKRESYLLAHFINHAEQLVYASEIIEDYYTGESNDSPMTICSKILSPLNSRLVEITGVKNAIKTVDAQYAYILDLG